MKPILTEGRRKRLQQDWTKAAGEHVELENGERKLLGYCSQIGCQRLLNYYHNSPKVSMHYSGSRESWCVSLEVSF